MYTANATSQVFENSCGISRNLHDIPFPLHRGTSVYYRVSSGGLIWSGVLLFNAPDAHGPDFTFSLLGDMGINCQISSVPQLISGAVSNEHHMVVHYGDIAYNLDDQCGAVGDLFMNAVSPFASLIPTVWGVGNHETSANFTYVDYLRRYDGQISMARASGSPSIRYLSFNVGLVHIAMVDTDSYIYEPVFPICAPQYEWLENDLKNVNRTQTPWLILIGHRAMYCDKMGDDECDLESLTIRNGLKGNYGLEPLMLKYGVDMYFAGHTHHYQREYPVARGQLVQLNYNNPRAPVHIQSGIGGLDGGDAFPLQKRSYTAFRDEELNIGFSRLIIHNASAVTFQQLFAVNGTVLDTVTIVQNNHGPFESFL